MRGVRPSCDLNIDMELYSLLMLPANPPLANGAAAAEVCVSRRAHAARTVAPVAHVATMWGTKKKKREGRERS